MRTVHDEISLNNNHMKRNSILAIYIENSDCQVNINVSIILYKIHFPILLSTKTMSNESLSLLFESFVFEISDGDCA
jgi:hypothetical protein